MASRLHDEILTWLYKNVGGLLSTGLTWRESYVEEIIESAHNRAETVLAKLRSGLADFGKRKRNADHPSVPHNDQEIEWLKKQIAFYEKYEDDCEAFKKDLGKVPDYPGVKVKNLKLQSPVYARSQKRHVLKVPPPKIVGFMDMQATVLNSKLVIGGIREGFRKNTANWIAPEIEFTTNFPDESASWYFDVRTSVENIGQLIREIEILKSALGDERGVFYDKYVVVAPHTELSIELLQNQNIEVVDYDPEFEFEETPETESNARRRDDEYAYEILSYRTFVIGDDEEGGDDEDYEEESGWSASYDLPTGRD